jgi:tripeptide aminopeptidase
MTMSAGARVFGLTVVLLAERAAAAQDASAIPGLLADPKVRAALAAARATEPRALDEMVEFCEVPAPPFKEGSRGEVLRRAFQAAGLTNVRVDKVGNVIGDRSGLATRPRVVVAAHLDTVFPEGTPVKVTRDRHLLRGPGIGDNCRGLAVLVSIARALKAGDVQTPGTVTFVANVGEEGLGDLRGMKTLFNDTLKGRVDRFVSIDGPGLHVTHVAVGSLRYRITFKGPGGHSFGEFGMPNPANALGRAVAKIADLRVTATPRTTFNVGRIGGGTSVNAIPSEAWMELDLRSTDAAALAGLDGRIQQAIDSSVEEENRRWGREGRVTVAKELVGNRPAGVLPPSSAIVQTVRAAGQALLGVNIPLSEGSTDANLPLSLDIPAVTIGAGGAGDGAHATTEVFDSTDSWKGTQNAVLVTVALAQP